MRRSREARRSRIMPLRARSLVRRVYRGRTRRRQKPKGCCVDEWGLCACRPRRGRHDPPRCDERRAGGRIPCRFAPRAGGRPRDPRRRRRRARRRHGSGGRAGGRSAVQCRTRRGVHRRRHAGDGRRGDGRARAPGRRGRRDLRAEKPGAGGARGHGTLAARPAGRRRRAGFLSRSRA